MLGCQNESISINNTDSFSSKQKTKELNSTLKQNSLQYLRKNIGPKTSETGGDCSANWITWVDETWCSVQSLGNGIVENVCCCIVSNHYFNQGLEYIGYRFKYNIPEAVLTEIYFEMDWHSDTSSDTQNWSGVLDSGGNSSAHGCEGGGEADCCTLGQLLYDYCPGTVHLTLVVRYKTSLNGTYCNCNSTTSTYHYTGHLSCS